MTDPVRERLDSLMFVHPLTPNTRAVIEALVAVLELHRPYLDSAGNRWCDADDCAGNDGTLTVYPCRTTQVVARYLGVEL